MRRLRFTLLVVLIAALAALVAGCGGSDPDAANTPEGAVTVTNAVGANAGEPAEGEGEADPAVAAGKTVFEGACQGCHADGGTTAGAGPVLVGKGLTEDGIKNQIINGGGAMPPGTAAGEDLDNVAKFVLSLQ